ncbi:MAG: hypothetical protein KFF45_10115 [Thioalkalivibrio sp.]|nr:hypothetical protein [Thioalkalivibrio sp.]
MAIAMMGIALLSGCGRFLPGEWEYSCAPSLLVLETEHCHARLEREGTPLAFIPEGDDWLFAAAWTGEDFQLIQTTLDTPTLRQSVRAEDGYCAGPICWIEFTDAQVSRIARRGSFRVELTRVFYTEEGRMRRGTTGFHVPVRGLPEALEHLRSDAASGTR